MRSVLRSVPVRAAAAASIVVATALALAGLAVLGVLRADLRDAAREQAVADANQLAAVILTGTLPGDAVRSQPLAVAVVGVNGQLLATNTGSTTGLPGVVAVAPSAALASPVSSADGGASVGTGTSTSTNAITGTGTNPVIATKTGTMMPAPASTSSLPVTQAQAKLAAGPGVAKAPTKVNGTPAVVYAAVSDATENSAVAAARQAMLIGLPLLLAVVAAVTWLVTRRALRPVEHIRDELSAIMDSSDLSRRVPEPAAQDAIGRLARTTNQTLAALEASLEQQHRFVADASHELRNPIASLRTQLEVGAAHPALLDVPGTVKDVARLQRLATDLLLLARLDAGERPPAQARVDLAELVREQVALTNTDSSTHPDTHANAVTHTAVRPPVRIGPLTNAEVLGSGRQLTRILANLLDNAQRHAATEVVVSVRTISATWVALDVTDDGAGVPGDQRERIFERFVRLDDARSRDEGGTGLGLAIARDLARRHGGTLTTTAREGRGAVFTLELPLPPATPHQAQAPQVSRHRA